MKTFLGRQGSWLISRFSVGQEEKPASKGPLSNAYSQAPRACKTIIVFGILAALIFYWFFVDWILASKRGFEFTDEALYLLAAREIGGSSSWGFPWGWHTAPLYALVGGDVAAFRTIGGYLLTLAGGVLGISAYLSLISRDSLSRIPFRHYALYIGFFGLVGVVSSFFYYAALLRAPSYNWVNLMGLLLAMIGGLLLLRGEDQNSPLKKLLFFGITSFGMVFASVGKPSSSVFVFIVLVAAWIIVKGAKRAALYGVGVIVFGAVYIGFLVLFRFWPNDFFHIFLGATQLPALGGSQVIEGALRALLSLPLDFLRALLETGTVALGLLGIALVLWSISFFFPNKKKVIRFLAILVSFFSATWIVAFDKWAIYDFSAQNRWVSTDTTMAWLIVLVVALMSFFTVVAESRSALSSLYDRQKIIVVAVALIAVPFIFGFGSSHGLLRQASLASVGFAIAILVLFVSGENPRPRLWIISSFACFSVFLALVVFIDSYRSPYRMVAVSTQVHEIKLRDKGGSSLLVDEKTKNRLEDYLRFADGGGIAPGDPLVGLVWRWNADVAYALNAAAPPGLMVTLFGYEGSTALGEWKLSQFDSSFNWSQAWVTVSETEQLKPEQADEVRVLLDVVQEKTGRVFPDDYRFIGSTGGIEFYAPR